MLLLGFFAAVLGLASKLVLRAVLAGVELLEGFYKKLVVGAFLGGGEGLLGPHEKCARTRTRIFAILCVLEREFFDTNIRHYLYRHYLCPKN